MQRPACPNSSRPLLRSSATKPALRQFHHAQDGIGDRSCVAKVRARLLARAYPEETTFLLDGGSSSVDAHPWPDEYSAPLLAFLASRLRCGDRSEATAPHSHMLPPLPGQSLPPSAGPARTAFPLTHRNQLEAIDV